MRFLSRAPGQHDAAIVRRRFLIIDIAIWVGIAIIAARLGKFQILDREMYAVLASGQHDTQSRISAARGRILVRDSVGGNIYPLATDRDAWDVYAVPKNMKDPVRTAHELAKVLGIADVDVIARVTARPDDPYEVIAKDVAPEIAKLLQTEPMDGVGVLRRTARLYPEQGMGGQVIGVLSQDDKGNPIGKYGIESAFQDVLAGRPGALETEKDAKGRRIIFAKTTLREAVDGSDVVLTLDRSVQYAACRIIREGVASTQSDSGTVIVLDPRTGAVRGMCSWPDFDPGNMKAVTDVSVLNNPAVFGSYEPGSVFKAFTVAGGVNSEKVHPATTYVDKGFEKIDDFTIRNSDGKANGEKTMTEVLELSLNTGTIFVERQLGRTAFRAYVKDFGFGRKTGIELRPEEEGDISSLDRRGNVFAATASFGQGISVTPIQLAAAYGALANGGRLMRPYIVDEVRDVDGKIRKTEPKEAGRPVSARTADTVTDMLVSVVEKGHSKRAGVPGYWIAGKTGTAQVAKKGGKGYEEDHFIATFIGYGPAESPKFVILVKLDRPRTSMWAEATSAPVFRDMAEFLIQHDKIPPTRETANPKPGT